MTIIRTAKCPECGATKDITSRQVTVECDVCYETFGNSKVALKDREAVIETRISQYKGEIMKLQEELALVRRAMIPLAPKVEVLWASSEFDLHCHNCGEVTRWMRRGIPLCADNKCVGRVEKKPVVRRSTTMTQDMRDLVRQMLTGKFPSPPALPNDDNDPDDTEYIKVRP